MLDIGIVVGTAPTVTRPMNSQDVVITVRGLREARSGDRVARVRLTLPAEHARSLWQQLGQLQDSSSA